MTASVSSLYPPPSLTPAVRGEIHRVFELQQATALRLRSSTPDERIGRLQRLRRALLGHWDAIVQAAAADFRRPAAEAELTELLPVLQEIADTCRHLKRWLKPRKVRATSMMIGTQAWTRYEPRGRCLIIAPWNYPVTLAFGPLVPAIASGNTVMIKTSEIAPKFSAVMLRVIREAFPEDEVAIFEGDVSVATALLELPFDHMFFTGAPAIGKVVMAAAARHLSSVTLELGGKSPTIIDASADLEMAVKTIAWGKFINSGQTCIAPDHVYVHESVRERVVELFRHWIGRWYGEGGAAKEKAFTRVINERHSRRIAGLLDDAVGRGATVLSGGTVDIGEHFIAPTMLGSIPRDAKIMQEEIFGPVLPIIGFTDIGEVIDRINQAPKPLALYIWSRTEAHIDRVSRQTSAGATCINHVGVHFLHHNLPFGGVNNSGIGSYHGEWGIRAFSHERAFLRTRVMLARFFFPPYTPGFRRLVRWMAERG